MFVVTFPTMINMCTKFHSNLRRCSVIMASPLGDLCWNDSLHIYIYMYNQKGKGDSYCRDQVGTVL